MTLDVSIRERSTGGAGHGVRGSVVIPAHNEGSGIRACLDAVLANDQIERFDVVVVCNGCTDDTAQIARGYPAPIRVVETPIGNKAKALQLGRDASTDGPTVYLDADVVISTGALRSVFDLLERPDVHGAAPAITLTLPDGASWAVRRYAAIWRQAPYFGRQLIGAGFFALDTEAQDRIGPWPELIADDLVALCHLGPHERAIAETESFCHELPPTLDRIWRAEVRREAGRAQFAAWATELGRVATEEDPGGAWLLRALRRPASWPGVVLFVGIKATAKIAARRALRRDSVAWSAPR